MTGLACSRRMPPSRPKAHTGIQDKLETPAWACNQWEEFKTLAHFRQQGWRSNNIAFKVSMPLQIVELKLVAGAPVNSCVGSFDPSTNR